jgi:four helix bundle protein
MSYRNLEIWELSKKLVISIHTMTINELPQFEMYETGSQIRRSSKSVKSNIVEGYGRRKSSLEYIHFLTIAHASLDETKDHLETLFLTKSLTNRVIYETLMELCDKLGRKLFLYIEAVKRNYRSGKIKSIPPNASSSKE